MKRFELNEEIPVEICDKYHDILGISNFTTMYAHKALNAQLELEEENEVSIAVTGSSGGYCTVRGVCEAEPFRVL